MICAISRRSMAHQWERNGANRPCAINGPPKSIQWRIGRLLNGSRGSNGAFIGAISGGQPPSKPCS